MRPLYRRRIRINRHAINHALHVAAWGSHVCRSIPPRPAAAPPASAPAPAAVRPPAPEAPTA